VKNSGTVIYTSHRLAGRRADFKKGRRERKKE
jgi:hypothetical protein